MVLKYLKNNSEVLNENINMFCEELEFISTDKPIIIALGNDTYKILQKYLTPSYYHKLAKITHYSHHIGKIKYRDSVKKQLKEQL